MVATHRYSQMPIDSMYLPIRVGSSLTKEYFGYARDDVGENISSKNPYFCELTALYWGWKNLKADFIGLVHYRRYFSIDYNKDKFARIMTNVQAQNICKDYDVIVPKKRHYYIETLYSHYAHTHDAKHLDITREIIAHQCPEYIPFFDKIMKRTWAHMFNMIVMKREVLDSYCTWLYKILFDLESKVDTSKMHAFDARLYGRVSELLLDIWLEKNQIKYKEVGFVQIGPTNWSRKIIGFISAKFFGHKYIHSK